MMNTTTSKNQKTKHKKPNGKSNGEATLQARYETTRETLRQAWDAHMQSQAALEATLPKLQPAPIEQPKPRILLTENSPEAARQTFVRLSVREVAELAGLLEFGPDPLILATDACRRASELCRLMEAALESDELGPQVRTLLASQGYRFRALADILWDLDRRVLPEPEPEAQPS